MPTAPHFAEARDVVTWQPDGTPRGIITGRRHEVDGTRGFEVDWITRFPSTPPGEGLRMCVELLAAAREHWGLDWMALKIHDDYHAEELAGMAAAFGFLPVARQDGDITVWRKDFARVARA